MTFSVPEGSADLEYAKKGGLYVPNNDGATTWFNGDLYAVMLSGEQTGGQIGLVEAMVPPGGGPPPHIHERTDETFYMVNGELEFLSGEEAFTASTGDVVFLPARQRPPLPQPGHPPRHARVHLHTRWRGGNVRGGRRRAAARRPGAALGTRAY